MTALRHAFSDPSQSFGPYIYYSVEASDAAQTAADAEKAVSSYKKDGYAGVIPYYPAEGTARPFTPGWESAVGAVIDACAGYGLKSGYFDDPIVMEAYLNANPENAEEIRCRVLNRYLYECTDSAVFRRKLPKSGKLMSVVALELDTAEILDLRDYVRDEDGVPMLEWQVAPGNWQVQAYVCMTGEEDAVLTEESGSESAPGNAQPAKTGRINMLDYDVCIRYFRETCGILLDSLSDDSRAAVKLFVSRDVQFGGKNRRMWSDDFNEVFRRMNGFDPAPIYPCLFQDAGDKPAYYRALLMRCRASLLADGYMKAAADFAAGRGLVSTGFAIESKATACSWFFGDGMLLHRYATAPGITMPFGYMYGLNGIKVAAGAADGFGKGLVCVDMFRRYPVLRDEMLYKETMNVFVRGGNLIMAHLGEDREEKATQEDENAPQSLLDSLFSHNRAAQDYAEFCARAQMLLRGGQHISDVAVVYPISSLHAYSYLFDVSERGFDYPATPENADYMADMNNLLAYCGTDAEFLHPEVLAESCYSDGGMLCRASGGTSGRFQVIMLPANCFASVRALRVITKFFDDGGRVIATGMLPSCALEGEEYDEEVGQLCVHIFGADAADRNNYNDVFENTSEGGGRSCFLMSNETAGDGVLVVDAELLRDALRAMDYAPDVILVNAPVMKYSGMVAYSLSVYRRFEMDKRLAHTGSVGCLHKRNDLCDVWYLANTTDKAYEDDVLLRGVHLPEEWNPYRGKVRHLPFEIVSCRGEVYTLVHLTMEAQTSTFLVSPLNCPPKEPAREYELPRR